MDTKPDTSPEPQRCRFCLKPIVLRQFRTVYGAYDAYQAEEVDVPSADWGRCLRRALGGNHEPRMEVDAR